MNDEETNNNCTMPLRFPLPPGVSQALSHGPGCTCCDPAERVSGNNRPALPKFNYRIGTYGSIREYLLHRINLLPQLRGWTHREADDPAIALLEGASILGDILTFYQETYANEAFLRTATWRESVADLVRLLGYRMSPAVGGKAVFAFEILKDEPVTIRAGFPVKAALEGFEKPSEFETSKEITAYPWLSRFNLFRPLDDLPITAATTEFYISATGQSLPAPEIKPGERLIVGEASAAGLTQPSSLPGAEIVIVDSVRELHGVKIYKVKGRLTKGSGVGKLVAYRLGRMFHHFGYNSADRIVDTTKPVTSTSTEKPGGVRTTESTILTVPVPFYRPLSTGGGGMASQAANQADNQALTFAARAIKPDIFTVNRAAENDLSFQAGTAGGDLFSFDTRFGGALAGQGNAEFIRANFRAEPPPMVVVNPQPGPLQFPIDIEVSDLPGNVPIVIQARYSPNGTGTPPGDQPYETSVRTIADIRPATFMWGSISGNASLLTLSEGFFGNRKFLYIVDALFHEVTSPLFEIKAAWTETAQPARGRTLKFFGTAGQAETLRKRPIMLERPGAASQILSVADIATTGTAPPLHIVTLSREVIYSDFPNEKPFTTVYGNLAEADEGKTVPETVIGSGDATLIFQNLKLPKAPLTYHLAAQNTPPETPETEVYVDGRLWTQVDSLFGHSPNEQIYIVREDGEGNSWVQFGDGKTGARPNTGSDNITAVYRTGSGSFGPLQADTKVEASEKVRNLDKILLAGEVTGGSTPEDAANARSAAPGKLQGLGRIVSLQDIEAEAAAIPGVVIASAAWGLENNVPAPLVTILMETGRRLEVSTVTDTMNSYNQLRGAAREPIEVRTGLRKYVAVSIQCVLKPTFRADVVGPQIYKALGINYGRGADEAQGGLFSPGRQRFGGSEYAASIEGVTQNVEGVLWAKTIAFDELPGVTDDPASIPMTAPVLLKPAVSCLPGQILSLFDKHLSLIFTAGDETLK
jgi:hypothetical protein